MSRKARGIVQPFVYGGASFARKENDVANHRLGMKSQYVEVNGANHDLLLPNLICHPVPALRLGCP